MKNHTPFSVMLENHQSPTQLPAILNELQQKLTRLLNEGLSDSIDLRSLPLFPGELEKLKLLLGKGEIQVKLDTMGHSDIYETAVAGIWWVTHYNQADDVVAEYLQVTLLPDILSSAPSDLQPSLKKLKQLLSRVSECIED